MKTTRYERIITQPVTIHQEVRQVVDVPTIDCTTQPVVEVANYPDFQSSKVLLNGVLLNGARLRRHELRPVAFGLDSVNVTIDLPYGSLHLKDVNLILTQTVAPQQVEWTQKRPTEDMVSTIDGQRANSPPPLDLCVVPNCNEPHIFRSSYGQRHAYCGVHYGQLHPSKR